MSFWAKHLSWARWGETGDTAAPTYSITGTINDSAGAGLDGVTVTLTGDASDSVVTAGGGLYEFTGLAAGSYALTPTKAGSTFLPAADNVTIVATNKTATTMAQVWQITGQILDSAGAGLSGATVTLSGDASDTDTTDGSGNYSFAGLADGSYTVTPTKAGSTFNPTSRASTVSGADDAVSSMAQVWEIAGDIVDSGDAGISGVLVTLSGDASDTDTTGGDGSYSFPGLSDGSYTVTPTKDASAFNPTSRSPSISGADVAVVDIVGATLAQPYIENFEDDTIGDNEATLEAKITHYDVYVTPTVRAIDYEDLTPILGNQYDNCISQIGTSVVGDSMVVPVGYGFVPSDNAIFLAEAVMYVHGGGGQAELWCRTPDDQEGILAYFNGSQFRLSTIHGGSLTDKVTIASGLTSTPFGVKWFVFQVQYVFSTDTVYFRLQEMGASGNEDTGWKSQSITPTFDDSEWRKFQALSKSDSANNQGLTQLRVCDQAVGGYGDGAMETATYVDLIT